MEIRYYFNLLRSVLGFRPVREWRLRAAFAFPGTILAIALLFGAFRAPGALGSIAGPKGHAGADQLMARATEVKQALESVDHVYEDEVAPLARVLMTYRNDEVLANRIAVSLVREGRRANLSPDILLAVLLVENPWINPAARSPVGARGLMQVMPLHEGKWRKCPKSLDGIESNICYGAQIFRQYMREEGGQVERALLRYNGCVNATNTPNCHVAYPAAVFANVRRAKSIARRPNHDHSAD
jgi:soluble lytic murein transglycosylase-like protein